jgi:hypothetical protein
MAQDGGAVLAELSSAGMPWLAVDLAGPASPVRLVLPAGDVTVIDIADPQAVPVEVNPFEPGPGYPVQAHADRVAGLFEAAFGLTEPVAAAVRAGLRRTYLTCGWDTLTGRVPPGAVAPPAVPAFRQFRTAVMAATEELGYSQSMRAGVNAFLRTRLDILWTGPAGRFLEGGHPADLRSLLAANVVVTNGGVADEEAVSFLAGVLLVRLAEQPRPRAGSRLAVVIGSAGALNGHLAGTSADRLAAGWFSRLTEDIRSRAADIVVIPPDRTEGGELSGSDGSGRSGGLGGVPPVLLARRSAACGERCRRRPCQGYELHAAGLLAHDDGQAWLRVWTLTLVLAFLTGRPVPCVPVPLRAGWQALSPRRRECVLATVIDGVVSARATALRRSYDPLCLTSVIAAVAARMLDVAARGDVPRPAGTVLPSPATPFRAGHAWVIPQLRWLHEIERVSPLGQDGIRFDDIAPPLDFGLAGLPDWPGIRVKDRLGGLRRHPLSMESARNSELASVALLGDDGPGGFDADLAIAGMGLSPLVRLRHAARMMGAGPRGQEPGWLEVVLSWPDRIIRPAWNSDVRRTATG